MQQIAGLQLQHPKRLHRREHQQEDVEGRKDANGPAPVELAESDPSLTIQLVEQERRNQESRQHEEDPHAEIAEAGEAMQRDGLSPRQMRHADQGDRDGADAIE